MPDFLRKRLSRQPAPRPADEDADLEQFFTDAEQALQVFEKLVSTARPPKRLLVIHGVGGVGKSTLLKMYRLSCRRRRTPVALVGGQEALSSAHVLMGWANDLSGDGVALSTFQSTLTHYHALQAKVEAEAEKTGQTAEKLGKAAAKTAIEMAASAIPVVGPLAAALGGAGAEAFVDWLCGFLSKPDLELYLDPAKRLTDDFLSDLIRTAARQRLILMADTYEQMTTLDDWVRDLAQRLPEAVLLVIAGRAMPKWDRAWPGWMGGAEMVELKEMTPNDLRTLVRRYYAHIRVGEPDPGQVEAIVEFARGLPMVVTTVVQLWVRHGVEDFQAVRPQVVADLVDRLLEGVSQEMRPVFEVAAVLRYFNADSLRALLDVGDADTLYAELRRWPFIRPRCEGLAVHDTMREMMNEALRLRSPERFRILHERAAAYYEAWLERAGGDERERDMLEWLYHSIRADERVGIRLFQETAEELVCYHLVNRLRALLNDANTYPLEQENSRLWREYYNARLMYSEARLADAGKVYESISENERAESKLCAYALCDWGELLAGYGRLGQTQGIERATRALKQSLEYEPLDFHLSKSLFKLARVARYEGHWDRQTEYLEKARHFFEQQGDNYGLAYVYSEMRRANGRRGIWKDFFIAHERGMAALSQISTEPLALRAALLGEWVWAWALAGRFAEGEQNAKDSLAILRRLQDNISSIQKLRDLGWALGVQGRFDEADKCFGESLDIVQQLGESRFQLIERGNVLGFWGAILIRRGQFERARDYLTRDLKVKESLHDVTGILEPLNWLGLASEIQGEWSDASNYYQWHREWKWYGRYCFECEALTGLVRVKHALGDYAIMPPLLAEAEQLAQQYEYNDHLASLRLTQGHIAWEGRVSEWGSGFDAALHYYQQALIYALRYNRFLLDEMLWGGGVATPLHSIIPHCLERDDEGRRMLVTLRSWWQTGVNDIGTPRPDTISPIPEGISLLEAERIARKREPGGGSPQWAMVEQVERALAETHGG